MVVVDLVGIRTSKMSATNGINFFPEEAKELIPGLWRMGADIQLHLLSSAAEPPVSCGRGPLGETYVENGDFKAKPSVVTNFTPGSTVVGVALFHGEQLLAVINLHDPLVLTNNPQSTITMRWVNQNTVFAKEALL